DLPPLEGLHHAGPDGAPGRLAPLGRSLPVRLPQHPRLRRPADPLALVRPLPRQRRPAVPGRPPPLLPPSPHRPGAASSALLPRHRPRRRLHDRRRRLRPPGPPELSQHRSLPVLLVLRPDRRPPLGAPRPSRLKDRAPGPRRRLPGLAPRLLLVVR